MRVAWAAWVQGLLGLAKAALFITLAVVIVQQVNFGPSRLAAARADVISRFEQERRSRVIALIHRQETVSVFGVPVSSNISYPQGAKGRPSMLYVPVRRGFGGSDLFPARPGLVP